MIFELVITGTSNSAKVLAASFSIVTVSWTWIAFIPVPSFRIASLTGD